MQPRKHGYLRSMERRQREDEAPRLKKKLPKLAGLRLEISETGQEPGDLDVRYIRHVVVNRAPALFDLPCSDPRCEGGGHDITRMLMSSLRKSEDRVRGEHYCGGVVKGEACPLKLDFVASATYET